ncbi:MAG: dTDP-4-dehydrorhamnose reductase [Verrucomicrobiota bacterium]|jgi:dTDP-4-dehydrorhamnose reductase|nr:dTDP-4-dehydrorhamnose reductase [Verrucomicrobiota bacterium]
MKILVTGGWGQLGWDCREVFAPRHEVLALDLPNLDITDAASVDGILNLWKPDAIVNCAAYTAVDRAESDVAKAWHVNRDGPALLASRAKAHDLFLLHVSTDYVFDGTRPIPEPYVETDAPNPISTYGKSKLAGEREIEERAPRHAILRTAWLYGAHGYNFLKTILRRAVNDPKKGLRVVNDQYGSPTWSRRLAHQILAVLEADTTGLFHASGEGYGSWFDFASAFLSAMGLDAEVRACTTADYPTPTTRPTNSILENAALKRAGLNQMKDWREDLQAFASRYRDSLLREVAH